MRVIAVLPNDVARCLGLSDKTLPCSERDTCRRYLERDGGTGLTRPFKMWACLEHELKIEVQS